MPIVHDISISRPSVSFRYDPGEPPLATARVRPTDAPYAIVTQEIRNQTRLAREATARGEEIVYSATTYTPGMGQDGRPILAGGHTVVRSRERDDNLEAPGERDEYLEGDKAVKEEPGPTEEQELMLSEAALNAQKTRTEHEIQERENEGARADSLPEMQQKDREANTLELKLQRIERELKELRRQRILLSFSSYQQQPPNGNLLDVVI